MALTGLTNLQPLHIKTVGIGTFDNTVSIGGTLTYEDVTNVDAIGIITARDDINIITDGKKLNIGASADLQLHHTSNHSYIDDAGAGNLRLRSGTLEIQNLASSKTSAIFSSGGGQTLNFNNQTKFVTTNTGVVITGICTATSFSGDGSGLTGLPAGTTINNNANNRVITGSDTTGTLEGEANLTFDGAELDLNNSGGSARLYLVSGNSADSSIYFGRQNDGATGGIRYEHTDNSLQFMGYNNSERLRIDSSGRVSIGDNNGQTSYPFYVAKDLDSGGNLLSFGNVDSTYSQSLTLNFDSNKDMKWSGGSGSGGLLWNIGTRGYKFQINGTERFMIDSVGRVVLNNAAVGSNEYLTIGPNGSTACDMAFRLNSDTDARIKFYDNVGTLRGLFGYTTYANNSTYPNFHDSFYLQTDPGSNGSLSTALWVSNSGQFIKPLTYKFLVETNGTSVSGGWNKLTGLSIDSSYSTGVSNGTYWSNSNQRFTAPVSGTYYFFIGGFSSTAEGGGTNHRYMYVFQVNGSGLKYGFGGNYSDGNTPMEGGSMHIPLNVNDYVEVQYYTAISATWGAGHRFFWGGYFLG